jgi:hypothetical protein
MFQQSTVTVVILGSDDYQAIGAFHLGREDTIFNTLSGVICRQGQTANIDQLGLDPSLH